jgi:hypothetical protein
MFDPHKINYEPYDSPFGQQLVHAFVYNTILSGITGSMILLRLKQLKWFIILRYFMMHRESMLVMSILFSSFVSFI